jgi:hypothetical protein
MTKNLDKNFLIRSTKVLVPLSSLPKATGVGSLMWIGWSRRTSSRWRTSSRHTSEKVRAGRMSQDKATWERVRHRIPMCARNYRAKINF